MATVGSSELTRLVQSPWFDAAWYQASYPDVACSGMDPARHYLELGEGWGRWPGPDFDPAAYRQMYPDVEQAGVSPLLHFIAHGLSEGRAPRQLQAAAEDQRLWARTDVASSLAVLEGLRRSTDVLEAASAAWALARWQAWQGEWSQVVACLDDFWALDRPARAYPATHLLHAEALIQVGQLERALAAIEALAAEWPDYPDTDLVRANYQAASGAPPAQRLATLNRLWRRAGIEPMRLHDPAEPLTLDNLAADSHAVTNPDPHPTPQPLVSVIVPVYNAEATLPTALAGLTAQRWTALEVLVVDDASTDRSREIAERFAATDGRFRVLSQPVNQGAYAARNRGLREACGELITVQDSDDWSHPEKIARQVHGLLEHPNWMACLSHWVRCTTELWFGQWRLDERWVYRSVSSLMIRRAVFETLGFWDRVRVEADTEYVLRIEAAFGLAAIGDVCPGIPLSFGRHRPDSLSQATHTHLVTQFGGWRRDYREAATAWHARCQVPEALYLADDPDERPFPLPEVANDR